MPDRTIAQPYPNSRIGHPTTCLLPVMRVIYWSNLSSLLLKVSFFAMFYKSSSICMKKKMLENRTPKIGAVFAQYNINFSSNFRPQAQLFCRATGAVELHLIEQTKILQFANLRRLKGQFKMGE
ncbi:hypothetical protein Tcan_01559 [Toxocara canis]|uniref:Uncharacterized protein n=1 Tax=Toxocara canis TaxID=6265 RepID=A0A0B2VQ37_TOXCA|nr:hypothetical protein Tcan_01559 [Toxocara canis]